MLMLAFAFAACGSTKHESASTILSQGLAAQLKGDDAAASADYLAVIARQPGNYVAWYDLGVIAQKKSDAGSAAHDYDEALAANPNYVPALFNLAILETKLDPAKAATLYQQILALQPTNAGAHLNYGFLLESMGQTVAGKSEIAHALALDPSLGKPRA